MDDQTLFELYCRHRGKISDKWSLYIDEYARIFESYRQRSVRILEIGIQNGGSLEIWSDYFSSAVSIVGSDIDVGCSRLVYTDPRIKVVIGDACLDSVAKKILAVSASFDIVIDDGSHRSEDIVKGFAHYFKALTDGGVYVVEDLHCSYWKEYEGGLFYPLSSISFFKALADVVSHEHWGVPLLRRELIEDFSFAYKFDISENLLAEIHSVEFINSMCVVRKTQKNANILGGRFIAGTEALVNLEMKHLHSSLSKPPVQIESPWSVSTQFSLLSKIKKETETLLREQDSFHKTILHIKDENISELIARAKSLERINRNLRQEKESQVVDLGKLTKILDDLVLEHAQLKLSSQNMIDPPEVERRIEAALAPAIFKLEEIKASTSWRVTAPVRWGGTQVIRARRLAHVIALASNRHGGILPAAQAAMRIYRKKGLAGLRQSATSIQQVGKTAVVSGTSEFRADYAEWVRRYDTLDADSRVVLEQMVESMPRKPLISILMPAYNPNVTWLAEAIASVQSQIYPFWELCVADDASPDAACSNALAQHAASDARIKLVRREKNGHISAASNSALALVVGEWTALMDQDDLLPADALVWVATAINANPDVRLIYSDEDKVTEDGHRFGPYFKSDWNIDLFRSHNMFSHLGVYQTALLREVGGFQVGMEGSQDYDLVLRCIDRIDAGQILHIPKILYHWRVHAESTASSTDAKPYAQIAGEQALNAHLARTGVKGRVEVIAHGYRVHYDLPEVLPLVTLIIPTRNAASLVRQCVDSIVALTNYGNYEIIIVDNGSDDAESIAYFETLSLRPGFKIIKDDGEFNYSLLNNMAVAQSSGDVIGLINNDIEVISPDWLSEMVSISLQPGVGAVGARLWYPNDTLQHGGVILGVGGVANHSHKNLPRGRRGYFGRADLIQSFSAVTAACLIVRRDHYEAIGGLDEENLKVAFNDVDFCLRLRELGLRNVWTPYAELYHHESATRGEDIKPEKRARFVAEVDYMMHRWGDELAYDPAYNPNLTISQEDFGLAWPPRGPKPGIKDANGN